MEILVVALLACVLLMLVDPVLLGLMEACAVLAVVLVLLFA